MLLSNLSKGLAEIKATGYGERVEITTERTGSRRSGRNGQTRRRRNSPNKTSSVSDLPTNRNKNPLVLPKTFTTRKGPLVLYTDSSQSRDPVAGNWSKKSTASRNFKVDFLLQKGTFSGSSRTSVSDRKPPSVATFAEAVLNFDPGDQNKKYTAAAEGRNKQSCRN